MPTPGTSIPASERFRNQEFQYNMSVRPYDEKHDTPLETLGLNPQVLHASRRSHVTKVGITLEMAKGELLKIRGFSEAEYEDLLCCLQTHDYL
jgi:hypothetical protein